MRPDLAGEQVIFDLHVNGTGVPVLEVSGPIDGGSAPELHRVLHSLMEEGHYCILIDLKLASYLDSSGIRELLEALHEVHSHQGQLELISPSPDVQQMLDTSRVSRVLPICEDEQEALEMLDA